MAPYRFRVFHMSTWIHSGANRTPPLDVPFEKKVRFADVFLRVHSMFIGHFDLEIYLYSTTYIPLPPSHTTHSVGSTGLALWVYAVCGVWGGWVGSLRW